MESGMNQAEQNQPTHLESGLAWRSGAQVASMTRPASASRS